MSDIPHEFGANVGSPRQGSGRSEFEDDGMSHRTAIVEVENGATRPSFLRILMLMLVALAQLGHACPSTTQVENIEELGFGFRRIMLTEPSPFFEDVGHYGHFEFLYYRDQRLCQVENCSVSPSGSYVLYQDGPSGNLFLFRRADGKRTQLTSQFVSLARRFEWNKDASTVEVHFENGASQSYSLSEAWVWAW